MEARGLFGNSSLVIIACVMAASFLVKEARARQVYKWVDHSGVTHYDQEPPEDTTLVSELLLLPHATNNSAGASNYIAVIEMAERLERSRLERRRLRLAREKADTLAPSMSQAYLDSHNDIGQYRYIVQPKYIPRHCHHRYASKRIKRYNRHKRKGVRAVRDVTDIRGSRGISTR